MPSDDLFEVQEPPAEIAGVNLSQMTLLLPKIQEGSQFLITLENLLSPEEIL